jgi:hypothetical protein
MRGRQGKPQSLFACTIAFPWSVRQSNLHGIHRYHDPNPLSRQLVLDAILKELNAPSGPLAMAGKHVNQLSFIAA